MPDERIGLILKNYIGDAVMVLPLLSALIKRYDQVIVAAGEPALSILRNVPGCKLFPVGNRAETTSESYRRFYRECNVSTVLLVNRSFRSAWSAWAAKVPNRVGHVTESRGLLLTERYSYRKTDYEAASYYQLGCRLGLEDPMPKPCLEVDPGPVNGSSGIEGRYVLLQPGARYLEKQIPAEIQNEIVSECLSLGFKCVLVGDGSELQVCQALNQHFKGDLINLAGRTTIQELLHLAQSAAMTVASDTGVSHVSVALGVPTVMLFGPNSAMKWGHPVPNCYAISSTTRKMDDLPIQEIQSTLSRVLKSLPGCDSAGLFKLQPQVIKI